MSDRGECRWCGHPWQKHDNHGCWLIVGAGYGSAQCPCNVTNPAHGQDIEHLERMARR